MKYTNEYIESDLLLEFWFLATHEWLGLSKLPNSFNYEANDYASKNIRKKRKVSEKTRLNINIFLSRFINRLYHIQHIIEQRNDI